MGCHEVRRVIYFYLDGAVSKTKFEDIASHLTLCPECDERKRIHQRLRDFIRSRFSRIGATDRLKTRVSRSLRAVRVDL